MESKAFYTTAAAVLLALFVAIGMAEGTRQREARRAGASMAEAAGRWRLVATLALVAAFLLGEACALVALSDEPIPTWTEWTVGACMLVAVLSALALAFDAIIAQVGPVLATLVAVVLGVGAIVYLVVRSTKPVRLRGPYVVGGTCADLTCGLRQHIAPRFESPYSEAPILHEGSRVYIRCQIYGSPVYLHHGKGASIVWDYLQDDRYVSDLFLDTHNYGALDPSIPRCPESQRNAYIGEHPHG